MNRAIADTPSLPPCTEQIARAQRLRLRRTLLSGGFYLVATAVLLLAASLGLLDMSLVLATVALFTVTIATFLVLIRTGTNLRFREPSLTTAQILVAMLNASLVMAYAGALRGAIVLAYMLPIQFGAFALPIKAMLRLCVVPILAFPLSIWTGHLFWPGLDDLRRDLVLWAVLALVLPFSAYISGRLYEYGRFKRLSDLDELTGLYNRRYMSQYLALQQASPGATHPPLCLALVDLDHFKRINDSLGHRTGDDALRLFARTARAVLRRGDLVARWGGEEFLFVIHHADPAQARITLDRLRQELASASATLLPPGWVMTASAGLVAAAPGLSADTLIARADAALYAAKASGRDRVETAAGDPPPA